MYLLNFDKVTLDGVKVSMWGTEVVGNAEGDVSLGPHSLLQGNGLFTVTEGPDAGATYSGDFLVISTHRR